MQNVPYFSLKLGAAYYNLGAALCNSGHYMKAAQRYLHSSRPRSAIRWARGTGQRSRRRPSKCQSWRSAPRWSSRRQWWNDEELKALSARVLRAAPNDVSANIMRAMVLRGGLGAWEAGPRSAAELKEAAKHYERSAALSDAPAAKAEYAGIADRYRSEAEAM